MTATALWAATLADFDVDGLIQLTNPGEPDANAVNTTAGESAAQAVITLWPVYTQTTYDASDDLHVEIGKHATIAMLWRRGGSSQSIEQVKWDRVFDRDNGMASYLRRTDPRAHRGPSSNSDVSQKNTGERYRGWSDRESLPSGMAINRKGVV